MFARDRMRRQSERLQQNIGTLSLDLLVIKGCVQLATGRFAATFQSANASTFSKMSDIWCPSFVVTKKGILSKMLGRFAAFYRDFETFFRHLSGDKSGFL